MSAIQVGDLVTIATRLHPDEIVLAIIVEASSVIGVGRVQSDAMGPMLIALALEGIEWTRGHHRPGSTEAAVLLAAFSLWRTGAP